VISAESRVHWYCSKVCDCMQPALVCSCVAYSCLVTCSPRLDPVLGFSLARAHRSGPRGAVKQGHRLVPADSVFVDFDTVLDMLSTPVLLLSHQ
jgi:hypothetical protein